MASLVIPFFSSLIPSIQRTNFCNFATKANKIAKTVGFSDNFMYKLKFFELYRNVAVKFSPILIDSFEKITAKEQNIRLELQKLAYRRSSGAAKNLKGGGA